MTNYENIKNMSIDDIADMLVVKLTGIAPCNLWQALPTGKTYLSKKMAINNVISWLKNDTEQNSTLTQQGNCLYCNGTKTEYQHTRHTKLFIDTFGNKRTLIVECHPCPPFANCSLKNLTASSAFIINYCPHCGRDLSRGDTK